MTSALSIARRLLEDAAYEEISASCLELDYEEEGVRVVPHDTPQESEMYESADDDFDLVDEIYGLPDTVPTIQAFTTFSDEEGIYDSCESAPVEFELDEYDIEDGKTIGDIAASHLRAEGAVYASASHFHKGVWYSSEQEARNDGTFKEVSWHLRGFKYSDEEKVFNIICHRQR